jgi:hypothetical protein
LLLALARCVGPVDVERTGRRGYEYPQRQRLVTSILNGWALRNSLSFLNRSSEDGATLHAQI